MWVRNPSGDLINLGQFWRLTVESQSGLGFHVVGYRDSTTNGVGVSDYYSTSPEAKAAMHALLACGRES